MHRCSSVYQSYGSPVGASLLAKVVNGDACTLNICGVLAFFASKLAPTVQCSCRRKPLRHCAAPARPARENLHRGSGWCC
ncbi:hypothetical protein EKA85_00295 [Pseudomonas veronii]|nr:hypothetical protein EKA85_00295 [Pseudomonas veronii]RTY79951.1 hypothetical protein EKA83_03335 [Pseudomonas veronii]